MMQSVILFLFLLSHVHSQSAVGRSEGSFAHQQTSSRRRRTVMAWANSNPAAVSQLQNSSWKGVFDGVQAFCGVYFLPHGGLYVNRTKWNDCQALRDTARAQGIHFYACIEGKVPDHVQNIQPLIEDAVAFATKYNLDGFSLDDEYDCAPRSTLHRLQSWMTFVNAFAQGLQDSGLELSAAVQAMFGIQNVSYNPNDGISQACKDPSRYAWEPRVPQMLADSPMERWLVMDTYYFSTGRFLNVLDWHVQYVPSDKLGIGIMNRDDLTEDGLVSRFHAMDKSGIDWINVFKMPVDDVFLPYLQRWKSHCAGCGVQELLGCYELSVPCNETSDRSGVIGVVETV